MQKQIENIKSFLRNTLAKTNQKGYVLGLSGGLDSAVIASLAIQAVGKEKVHLYYLPTDSSSTLSKDCCHELTKSLKTKFTNEYIDVMKLASAIGSKYLSKLDTYTDTQKLALGNIAARGRAMMLFNEAKMHDWLVLGTENKTESIMGYFTRGGDEMSDLEPIIHLYKTDVQKVGKILNIPDAILNRPPTAELWDGQTDEEELGLSYEVIDVFLKNFYTGDIHSIQLDKFEYADFEDETGISPEDVRKIVTHIKNVRFKHLVPYSLTSFGG